MIAVDAVCITVGVSSPRLVEYQRTLLLLTQTVLICTEEVELNITIIFTQKKSQST